MEKNKWKILFASLCLQTDYLMSWKARKYTNQLHSYNECKLTHIHFQLVYFSGKNVAICSFNNIWYPIYSKCIKVKLTYSFKDEMPNLLSILIFKIFCYVPYTTFHILPKNLLFHFVHQRTRKLVSQLILQSHAGQEITPRAIWVPKPLVFILVCVFIFSLLTFS